MNKKGQALVEFIIILPIFMMMLFAVIDLGTILYNRISLESTLSDVVTNYQSGKSTSLIESSLDDDLTLNIDDDGEYVTITITSEVDIITPGLNLILSNPYELTVTRSIASG